MKERCLPATVVGRKECHMFSSRLFPLFVRAVSFQTCDTPSRKAACLTRFGLLVRVGACRRFRLKYKKSLFKESRAKYSLS
ncbi:hypothetical protein ASG16_018370 [Brevibacillus sp. Leaf182]|nr:hypothetical protein ASG16_018370 [Brevibacillus sp. Leaf182]